MTEFVDVVIVGAGISGVSAAWHLQDRCPTKSYAILERRENMGGTWDLFRYPGIRSDSDMYTLGFRFRPWTERQAIAEGKPILDYVKSTAADVRHRQAHPVRAPGRRGELVERGRSLDSPRQPWRPGRRDHLQLPLHVQRLLQLRRGLLAGVRRCRGLHRADHPPAALAGGSRLPGQERRGDRQWCDGGDFGSGPCGFGGRARHHAAALAELHPLTARRGPDRGSTQPDSARGQGLRGDSVEERPAAVGAVPGLPQAPAADAQGADGHGQAPAARGL